MKHTIYIVTVMTDDSDGFSVVPTAHTTLSAAETEALDSFRDYIKNIAEWDGVDFDETMDIDDIVEWGYENDYDIENWDGYREMYFHAGTNLLKVEITERTIEL